MSFGWKVLLPLATLNLLVTAIIVRSPPAPIRAHASRLLDLSQT